MNTLKLSKKSTLVSALFFLALAGTYNALVINAESDISSDKVKFAKRLDETYGIVVPGRAVAATTSSWRKIKKRPVPIIVEVAEATPESKRPEALIRERLDLKLIEVINPRKWSKGLVDGQFSGSLMAYNGTIEYLSLALPSGEGFTVSFSEMSGNVFEYDINGEVFTGIIYQVDQQSYMLNLTNGPFEGTRLRYSQEAVATETAMIETVASNEQEFQTLSFPF